jgi:hypothetical protein
VLGVVAHAFDPSTWEAEAGGSLEFEASLVYRVSGQPRLLRETQSQRKKKKKKKKNKMDKLGMSLVPVGDPSSMPAWAKQRHLVFTAVSKTLKITGTK